MDLLENYNYFSFLVIIGTSIYLMARLGPLARRIGLVDKPNERKQHEDGIKTDSDSVAVYNISVNDSLITNVNLLVSITKDGVRSQYKINSACELIKFFTKEVMGLGNAKLNSITDKNSLNLKHRFG